MENGSELKRHWSDGTTHVLFSALELLQRLAALVPPPRFNMTRFHGVFAPNARDRERVVPHAAREQGQADAGAASPHEKPPAGRFRLGWAQLLKRVFQIDVECQHCGGDLKLISLILDHQVAVAICRSMGLPDQAPEISAARAPPQGSFAFQSA